MRVYVVFQIDSEWYGYEHATLRRIFRYEKDAIKYCNDRNSELTKYEHTVYKIRKWEVL